MAASSNFSPKVAVQGRAVVTDAPNYLLSTTLLRTCTAVAIRGPQVAILLHADANTTQNHIADAVSKAREMDREMDQGDLIVQYICHEDERAHYMELMDQEVTEGAICVASYRERQGVIVCMDSRKRDIYMLFSGLLYKGLNQIKAWSILYNSLQYDNPPRQFGDLFLETIDDVNSAIMETINALRVLDLERELVTTDGCVDTEELRTYIQETKQGGMIVPFLTQVASESMQVEQLYELYGQETIADGIQNGDPVIIEFFEAYIETNLKYAKEINDIVENPE